MSGKLEIKSSVPESKILYLKPFSNVIRVLIIVNNYRNKKSVMICGSSVESEAFKNYMFEAIQAEKIFHFEWNLKGYYVQSFIFTIANYDKVIVRLIRLNHVTGVPEDCLLICFNTWESANNCEDFMITHALEKNTTFSITQSDILLSSTELGNNKSVAFHFPMDVVVYTNASEPKMLA